MARPKKQVITPPVPTVAPAPVAVDAPEVTPHEFEIIRSNAGFDYHLDSHIIPAGGEYRLPGETYRKYSGRPAFDSMFADGILELVDFE